MDKEIIEMSNYVKFQLNQPCELIGNWLWVKCTDNNSKMSLEQLGFKYSRSKNMYYYRKPLRKQMSMDEIRAKYSNTVVPF